VTQPLRYPRPAELTGLGRRNAVVESSAGTGKTFLLEHLFVDLILSHGLSCEEILVVTFTEKATAELVLRLRGLLEHLAYLHTDDPMALAARDADPASVWTIDEAARARLAQSLLGHVAICELEGGLVLVEIVVGLRAAGFDDGDLEAGCGEALGGPASGGAGTDYQYVEGGVFVSRHGDPRICAWVMARTDASKRTEARQSERADGIFLS